MHKWFATLDFVQMWKASSIVLTGALGMRTLRTRSR